MFELCLYCFIAGIIGSILQSLIGIGTGIMLVPLLTFMLPHYGFTPDEAIHIALATSMAAIAVNALCTLKTHHYNKQIDWNIFKKIIFFSVLGAGIGAWVASALSGRYLRIGYGIFLLGIAFYIFQKSRTLQSAAPSIHYTPRRLAVGGLGIGFLASLVGSGGGILMVPFLRSLHLNMRSSVGTSTLISIPLVFFAVAIYLCINTQFIHWYALCSVSLASLLFAPIGLRLSNVLPTTLLERIFALVVSIIAIKMMVNAIL